MSAEELPSFTNPPVVETILGVDFWPVANLTNGHLGIYWANLKDEFPIALDQPPFIPQVEPRTSWLDLSLKLQVTQDPSSRLQLKNSEESRMIQLQKNLFRFNWIKLPQKEYPRYETTKTAFLVEFGRYVKFIAHETGQTINPMRWEVVYINHFPKGTVWNTQGDWNSVFSFQGLPTFATGYQATSFNLEWNCEIQKDAWMNVQASHGTLNSEEVLRLVLTAWGGLSRLEELEEGIDLGRKAIVTNFKQITSEKAHAYWNQP